MLDDLLAPTGIIRLLVAPVAPSFVSVGYDPMISGFVMEHASPESFQSFQTRIYLFKC